MALGLCDPVGRRPPTTAPASCAFADRAAAAAWCPAFSPSPGGGGHAPRLGWRTLRVAEEAVIDLPALDFTGKAWQDVRTALNQAAKQGITWRRGPLASQPRGIQLQVKAISAEWVEDRDLPEMGFTLGGVDEAMDPQVLVGLAVDADGTVNGVTSWMPIFAPGRHPPGWTLDVMRRLPGGFRYTMEFLIASACLSFREQRMSHRLPVRSTVGRAARTPPRGATPRRVPRSSWPPPLNRTTASSRCTRSRPSSSPRFVPLHLTFPDEAALPRIGVALGRAYLPSNT